MLKELVTHFLKQLKVNPSYPEHSSKDEIKLKERPIDANLDENLEVFKKLYSIPNNTDVKIRHLKINATNKKAAILFISSIIEKQVIEEHIIKPLLKNDHSIDQIEYMVTADTIKSVQYIKDVLDEVNRGSVALFIEGEPTVSIIGANNFQGRSIGAPENEVSLKGPKEAFNEKAMTNISLIRKKIRNENLVVESLTVSKRSKNDVFILYVRDLVNHDLLKRIKKKLDSLQNDAIPNLSLLEQSIDENKRSIFPTILYTERPDRATSFLEDGYIVLIMDNSPGSLVLPATFWSFYHTSDDHYLRFLYGNFTRFIRIVGLFITLFTSAIYVSITNFHAEMVPPDLLLAISANREKVPFPSFIEVLLMETAFELIREAGLRVPSPIGPTIGIVGALILGQAAVQANIVSPIVVIVVALGGLSSFVIGDISMNFAIRLIRFVIIFSAGLFGFYGMAAIFIAGLFNLVSIKSFGVPYLAPYTPTYISSKDTIFRRLIKNELFRPGYVKPKDIEKKPGDS